MVDRLGPSRRCALVLLLVVGVTPWVLSGVARADHCGATDKDHLADDSCGYFVEPVSSPSPSSTVEPSPIPVTVENEPTVKIKQPQGDDPLRVTVENQVQPSPAASGDGWQEEDRELLRVIVWRLEHFTKAVVFAMALGLFALAGIVVLSLPRIR